MPRCNPLDTHSCIFLNMPCDHLLQGISFLKIRQLAFGNTATHQAVLKQPLHLPIIMLSDVFAHKGGTPLPGNYFINQALYSKAKLVGSIRPAPSNLIGALKPPHAINKI